VLFLTEWPFHCREQERIKKTEHARLETERILQEKQAAVDAKKAEMQKREAEKEKVRTWSCVLAGNQPADCQDIGAAKRINRVAFPLTL
jgi:hypothetical protein